jgi:hypothetical protein
MFNLHMLEKIEWTISNGHSRDTGNTGHTRHRTKSSKASSTTTTTAKQNKINKQTNKQKNKNKSKKNKTKIVRVRAKGKQFLLPIRHPMLLINIAKSDKNIVSDKGKKTKFT